MNSTFLAALFMVLVLGMVLPFIAFYGVGKGIELEIIVNRDVYSLDNAIEHSKYVFAKNALTYSFYQAAYNASAQGGWLEPTSGSIASTETLQQTLENKTLEYYNDHYNVRPVTFLGYTVRMPDYQNITITHSGDNEITIEAYTGQLIEASSKIENTASTETVTIRRNASMNLTLETDVFRLHEKALTYSFDATAGLGNTVHELSKWPLTANVELDHRIQRSDNDAFYRVMMDQYFQVLRDEPFEESTAIKDAEVIIASNIDVPEGETTRNGPYLIDNKDSSVKVKITTSCSGSSFDQDGVTRSEKNCEFSYKAIVYLKTSIQDASPTFYPVFNGTNTTLEPIRFTFTAEQSFERKPETTT